MVGSGVSTLNTKYVSLSNWGRWVYMILSFSIFHFFKVDVFCFFLSASVWGDWRPFGLLVGVVVYRKADVCGA